MNVAMIRPSGFNASGLSGSATKPCGPMLCQPSLANMGQDKRSRFGADGCCCAAEAAPAMVAKSSAMDIAAMPLDPWSALGIALGSVASSFLSMLLFFGGGSQKPTASAVSATSEK